MARRRRRRYRNRWPTEENIFLFGIVLLAIVGFFGTFITTLHTVWQEHQATFITIGVLVMVVAPALVFAISFILRWVRKQRNRARYRHFWNLKALTSYLDDHQFEQFVAQAFEGDGYAAEVSRRGADQGIDIELTKGLKKYAVQVKQYRNHKVSSAEVRNFYGSYQGKYTNGFFVTSSEFTKKARIWGESRSMKLLDGAELMKMCKSK